MEQLLRPTPEVVHFESIFLDPNNPRLALEDQPGYADPDALFDAARQPELEKAVEAVYDVAALQLAVESQGWLNIDNIVVWKHPDAPDKYVSVEGNTRITVLRRIRARLVKEREKLAKMKEGRRRYAPHDVAAQERLVVDLDRIVTDTDKLSVILLAADSVEELERKLPRVLAVRHITGAKGWGNYAEDLWLLVRYETLFDATLPGQDLSWDLNVIKRLAREAAISEVKVRRQILAASCFSHFKVRFEDHLPGDEEFQASDYYLFENIVKKPWLREQFGLLEGSIHIPDEREDVLMAWVFQLERGSKADENPNIFYRHENVLLWDQMKRYDDVHKTAFAKRFNPDEPETAPRMEEVEAEWRNHKASRQPSDIIEQLLQQLGRLNADMLLAEGDFLRRQLTSVHDRSGKLLAMLTAAA